METGNKATGSRIIIIGEYAEPQSIPGLDTADIIVTFELSAETELKQERNLPALYFHRYAQSERVWPSTVAAAREWLETWPKKPVHNGQSLLETLKFEDTSLWWFVYDAMWETKNGIFDTFYRVKALVSLMQDFKPAVVELWGTFDFDVKDIAASLAKAFKFDLKVTDYGLKARPPNELTRTAGKLRLLMRFILLKAAKAFAKNKKHPVAFFLNHGSTAVEKRRHGVHIINDHYLEGLEGYMASDSNGAKILVSLNMPLPAPSYYKNLVTELGRTARGMYTPWLCYFSLSDLETRRRLVGHYQSKMAGLESDPAFRESMLVEGVDIYPMLKDTLTGSLPRALALVHSEILVARKFLNKEQPALVFHAAGVSASGRAITFACRQRNTRTVAPQLGIISTELPVNTGFLITKGFDKRLLPEYLVWGQFYKTLVTERGYPEALVKIVGFWRTERAPRSESEKQAAKPVSPGDYILYVAGANLGKLSYILSLDEEIATIKLIRRAMPAGGPGLLVKLHPSLPYDLYRKALHGIEGITLVGGPGAPGIEEFLPAAKAVVGKASTVLVQALILNKPVIVVNFASKLDFLGYRGVPFATTPEEFTASMKAALSGGMPQKDGFSLEYYCKAVGRESTSLIINEIAKE